MIVTRLVTVFVSVLSKLMVAFQLLTVALKLHEKPKECKGKCVSVACAWPPAGVGVWASKGNAWR